MERGIERYVFASSCSLYDGMPPGMHDENDHIQPRAAYATSKRYGEERLLEMVSDGLCPVLLRNGTNHGFARANNQAAEKARGRYLFFLNNDTVVPLMGLAKLLEYAEAHPTVGMIGPRLRDSDGAFQISYRRRPTVGALLHRTLLLRWTGLFLPPN